MLGIGDADCVEWQKTNSFSVEERSLVTTANVHAEDALGSMVFHKRMQWQGSTPVLRHPPFSAACIIFQREKTVKCILTPHRLQRRSFKPITFFHLLESLFSTEKQVASCLTWDRKNKNVH